MKGLSALALLLFLLCAATGAAATAQAAAQPPAGADTAAAPALPAVAAPTQPAGQVNSQTNAPANAPGTASALPEINLSWGGYFEALAVLCFCLAVLWAVLWLLRRRGGLVFSGAHTPGLRVESRLALGPKKWILVVRYQERRLIVGVTDKNISLLTEVYQEESPAPGENGDQGAAGSKSGLSFASLLKKDKSPSAANENQ